VVSGSIPCNSNVSSKEVFHLKTNATGQPGGRRQAMSNPPGVHGVLGVAPGYSNCLLHSLLVLPNLGIRESASRYVHPFATNEEPARA